MRFPTDSASSVWVGACSLCVWLCACLGVFLKAMENLSMLFRSFLHDIVHLSQLLQVWEWVACILTLALISFLIWAMGTRQGVLYQLAWLGITVVKHTPGLHLIYLHEKRKEMQKLDAMEEGSSESHEKESRERPRSIPEEGLDSAEVLQWLRERSGMDCNWSDGRTWGFVYNGDPDHVKLMNEVYTLFSQTNPLHTTAFPSVHRMEQEVVRMTATMMHGDEQTCGTVTSGGTESLLMACKVYRDIASEDWGIETPEILLPRTAHAAFEKAAHYFRMKTRYIEIDDRTGQADLRSMRKQFNRNVCMIVGSAPGYPHGVVDPIPEMASFARSQGVFFHVDGCLGGFIMPWLKELGYEMPDFDFSVPGVTSMSADLHKYGFSAKGASCILYCNHDLLKRQFFSYADWNGGLYGSPSFLGSRSGAIIATAWAALISKGRKGFLETSELIKRTADRIMDGIKLIDGLQIIAQPHGTVFAIGSSDPNMDVFAVSEEMHRSFNYHIELNQNPNSMHFTVTYRHVGREETILEHLRASVAAVRKNPESYAKGMAPIYGGAAKMPDRDGVADMIIEVFNKMATY